MKISRLAAVAAASAMLTVPAHAAGLKGSLSSMRNQHAVAAEAELDFLRTPKQVAAALAEGTLDSVPGNRDYTLSNVSFPYALPEVLAFIERIGAQYRDATGSRLVVTSLTRPKSLQPRNAHRLSVHPAGMAVDFRVPADATARKWLEQALLEFEREDVLDVTRERTPPHYHVAVFPAAFRAYAERHPLPARDTVVAVAAAPAAPAPVLTPAVTRADAAQADASGGFGTYALAAMIGIVLAGGTAARGRLPALAHPRRRRSD